MSAESYGGLIWGSKALRGNLSPDGKTERTSILLEKNVRKRKKRAKKHSHMSSSFVHNEDASKTSANSLVSSLRREVPSRVILTTPRGLPLGPWGPWSPLGAPGAACAPLE